MGPDTKTTEASTLIRKLADIQRPGCHKSNPTEWEGKSDNHGHGIPRCGYLDVEQLVKHLSESTRYARGCDGQSQYTSFHSV